MLFYWLKNIAPNHIKKIEVIFSVVGYSFLPGDRVISQIEKEIKGERSHHCRSGIICGGDNFFRAWYNSTHWYLKNWKENTSAVLKPSGRWHFKFNKTALHQNEGGW